MIADLTIRDAWPPDLAEIIAIEQRVFPHPWTASQLAFELNRQPVALNLVAVSDSRIRGYLMAHVIADVVNLNNLAVDLPVQHRGIGQRLMRSFLERVSGFNIRKVFLDVADTNLPAIRFYEKFGFSEIDIRKKYYHTGEDALVMVKEVSAYGLVQT